MEFHPIRQLHGHFLKFIRPEGNLLGPLDRSVNIGSGVRVGKRHIHIRDIRLGYTIIVKLHSQGLSGGIRARKSVPASIGIGNGKMRNDKLFACGKIRMLFCKESVLPGSFRPIITDLCQLPSVAEAGDRISAVPRGAFRGFHTIGRSGNIAKLYRVLIGHIGTKPIIRVIVCASPCNIYTLGGPCRCIDRHKGDGLPGIQRKQVDFLLYRLLHDLPQGKSAFLVISILLCCRFQLLIQLFF